MRRLSFALVSLSAAVLLAVLCSTGGTSAADLPAATQKQPPGNDVMRKKLVYSRNILEGLVNEDFAKIAESADALNQLGQQRWRETDSRDYLAQNQLFWFAAESLRTAAREQNLEGATLAYTQLTLSCVNCHKLLRKE